MSNNGDLFSQINNCILDLQRSDIQTFQRPLRKLGRLLSDPELQEFNNTILRNLDLEKFLEDSQKTQGGMVGTARLLWPDEEKDIIGLQLSIILKYSEEPDAIFDFTHTFFYTNGKLSSEIRSFVSQLVIPFFRDYRILFEKNGAIDNKISLPLSPKVFIVHGHDGEARESAARFIEKIGLEAIVLHEQANQGRTIIEKVEYHSDVGFAVVLLTPDDFGRAKSDTELEPRARQNVLLELGYFLGKLRRDRVCALKKGNLNIPSDFAGVVWEDMDDKGAWKTTLARELKAAGYDIDWNKIMK